MMVMIMVFGENGCAEKNVTNYQQYLITDTGGALVKPDGDSRRQFGRLPKKAVRVEVMTASSASRLPADDLHSGSWAIPPCRLRAASSFS
jgi:hypothetical protein